jgi:DTW domain-containing protein YfiP
MKTDTRVVILQHPRERSVPIGTARLAELGLPNSERHVGVDFEHSGELARALSNPAAPPILLFPGPGAGDLSELASSAPVTLVVIDGTWSQAEKILKTNPALARLPRYAVRPSAPSRYRIRKAPSPHCISTIEAIVAALQTLEGPRYLASATLAPFEALVAQQLTFKTERAERRHFRRSRPPRERSVPKLLAERFGELVVAYGEANAWPRGSALGGRGELIHFAAERLSTGERFRAFVRPERALSPTFTTHTGIGGASSGRGIPGGFQDALGGVRGRADAALRVGLLQRRNPETQRRGRSPRIRYTHRGPQSPAPKSGGCQRLRPHLFPDRIGAVGRGPNRRSPGRALRRHASSAHRARPVLKASSGAALRRGGAHGNHGMRATTRPARFGETRSNMPR